MHGRSEINKYMKLSILTIFLLASFWSLAQTPDSLPSNSDAFVEEITDYLKSVKRDETKETAVWPPLCQREVYR